MQKPIMHARRRLIFLLLFCTHQILVQSAPLFIQTFHRNEQGNKIVTTQMEIDDNLIKEMKPQMKDEATQTEPGDLQYELRPEDYLAYEFDCAMPIPPGIVDDYKVETRDISTSTATYEESQVRDTPSQSLLQSAVATANGIGLNILAFGFNLVDFFTP